MIGGSSKVRNGMGAGLPASISCGLPAESLRRLAQPPAAVALLVYLFGALAMFGGPLLHGGKHECICSGNDEGIFAWALVWWPHALLNGLNPFYSHIIYAPQGFNIALGALVPGAALLFAPFTAIGGPLFAFNVAMLLSPVLAAFFAFLLCRRLTQQFWAALLGGWLFGFSTYMLGQMQGHMHLTLVFLVPAIVHLLLRALAHEISTRWFVVLLVIALTLQFSFAGEVFVSFTLFGALALTIAFLLGDAGLRANLRALLMPIALAYAVTAVIVSPYLYYAFHPGGLPVLLWRTDHFTNDLLSFVIPTQITQLGGHRFLPTSTTFVAGTVEGGAYFGLPLIAIIWLAVRRHWELVGVRIAFWTLVVVAVCSLGGRLNVEGPTSVPLPWAIAHRLPVLGLMLPSRFIVYDFLLAAILASMWVASSSARVGPWLLASLSVAFLWPALGGNYWRGTPDIPSLFSASAYRRVVTSRDTALLLPVGSLGNSMLWQAEAHLRFKMASGYVVPPEAPDPYKLDPIYPTLTVGAPVPNEEVAAWRFLTSHHVTVAVLDPTNPMAAPWIPILERLGWKARTEAGAVVLRRESEKAPSLPPGSDSSAERGHEIAARHQRHGGAAGTHARP